ncbi:MAG: hypothetical protein KKF44_10710 [Nanoarchaeota archaeon]|nr:hypothetical protein [Nanoarchaeota archaeon]
MPTHNPQVNLPEGGTIDDVVHSALSNIAIGGIIRSEEYELLRLAKVHEGDEETLWYDHAGLEAKPGEHSVYYLGAAAELYADITHDAQLTEIPYDTNKKHPRLTFLYHSRTGETDTKPVFVQVNVAGNVFVNGKYQDQYKSQGKEQDLQGLYKTIEQNGFDANENAGQLGELTSTLYEFLPDFAKASTDYKPQLQQTSNADLAKMYSTFGITYKSIPKDNLLQ